MGLTIVLFIILFTVFVVQIGKARELASIVRADPGEEDEINKFHAGVGMFFMVAFLLICVWSFYHYIPTSLGWGPNTAASEHGTEVDRLFNVTLFFTSIVFFLTHIALFWFGWKYRGIRGKKATYLAHNEKLEMVWMIIPAIVMAFLVIDGLDAWNNIMTDLPEEAQSVILPAEGSDNEFIEIEATGSQFLWYLRYPGRDGKLGTKYFTQINSNNPLGQTWTDEKNIDDFMTTELVLPKDKKVRVRITARDVLHNFYIRDMRVKMDAVPGMPTYFIFTPTVTTDSMRRRLSTRPEWQVPDANDPTKERWETYNYELACAELCGRGHYSMRNIVRIVEEDEYLDWLDAQEGGKIQVDSVRVFDPETFEEKLYVVPNTKGTIKSQYFSKIWGTDDDPFKMARHESLEALVLNKLYIGEDYAAAKEIRNSYEYSDDEFRTSAQFMKDIKVLLNKARISNDVEEAKELRTQSAALLKELTSLTQKVEEVTDDTQSNGLTLNTTETSAQDSDV